jgi:hypothetical protein
MNILERINEKLTQKNMVLADRPLNSDLVLLVGRFEGTSLKQYIGAISFAISGTTLAEEEIQFDGYFRFMEMSVIPVGFESYLDIVRVI